MAESRGTLDPMNELADMIREDWARRGTTMRRQKAVVRALAGASAVRHDHRRSEE